MAGTILPQRQCPGEARPSLLGVVQVLLLLAAVGLAGVVAAIRPARRAARLDVLEAIAYE